MALGARRPVRPAGGEPRGRGLRALQGPTYRAAIARSAGPHRRLGAASSRGLVLQIGPRPTRAGDFGGEQTLLDLLREYKAAGPACRTKVHTHLRASRGSHYRRIVPRVLQALAFRSNNAAHRQVVEVLALLRKYAESQARHYAEDEEVPIEGVVPPRWRE